MRLQSWAWALCIGLLSACASVTPGADFPKAHSSAITSPQSTALGRSTALAAQEHGDLSGYRLLTSGVDGFLARMQLTERAERSLDLQYFILRGDVTGRLLAAAVLRAAERGVRVRVLVDDGETVAGDEEITALDSHARIEVRVFNPFAYRGHVEALRAVEFALSLSRLDYRMHNKLFVADNAVALIGGRNIGDQYFQVDPQSQFADDDVFVAGPMVRELSASFDEYWNSASAIPQQALVPPGVALPKSVAPPLAQRLSAGPDAAEVSRRAATGEPLRSMLSGQLPLVWAHAELVQDSPDKKAVQQGWRIGRLMRRPVANALKDVQAELLMITPYLIPGAAGLQLLQGLRARGVRIRMLTNSLESSTVSAAQAGYMRWRKPLLEAGVDLFELRTLPGNTRGSGESARLTAYGNYSLHAKLFVLDRQRVFIGSMNFDQRSMHLNTEVGLIIDSPELAGQAANRFEAMTQPENAFHVTLDVAGMTWRTLDATGPVELRREPARNAWQRIKVEFLRLFPLDPEL